MQNMNAIHSVWDHFGELLTCAYKNASSDKNKRSVPKQILLDHFMATQNQRPEFLFHLLLMYFSEGKFQKVE